MGSCLTSFQDKKILKQLEKYIQFVPPNPPKYRLTEIEVYKDRGPQYTKCKFNLPTQATELYPWIKTVCYQLKKTNNKKRIVLLQIRNNCNEKEDKPIMIYSHGSRSDLGSSYPTLIDMASIIKCDIVSYDYSGYGYSEGTPNEAEICSDIEHVIDFVLVNLNKKIEDIVLCGSSLGAVPSLFIASDSRYCSINGLILISPFSSAKGFVKEDDVLYDTSKDMFDNVTLASEVLCPSFIVHGESDTVVPVEQSKAIADQLRFTFTWYPQKANHYNIISMYRSKFYSKLLKYFTYLKENRNKNKKNALDINDQSQLEHTVIHLQLTNKKTDLVID